ncbi:MAG: hypothetical protein QG629_351 [Patescibacteria group bacterium]|nr:hypothetical protein [Candidatus Saccharibacteria bacterium]MDQ5963269.1 hypothetical protein [Patescibacteria group bacterium]
MEPSQDSVNEVNQSAAQPVVPTVAPANVAPVSSSAGNSKKKWLFALALALPLLVVGGAGAYYGVVLPNKPENVLKMAVVNSLSEENVAMNGTFDMESADKASTKQSVPATSITFNIGRNEDKTFAGTMNVAMSGVKIDADMRYIGENLYVKLGDLSTVASLADGYMAGASTILTKIQNQWVEADKTLLKQANVACFLESKTELTDADFKALNAAYDKNKFAEIKTTAKDTVNGKSATKFELLLDDNRMADFYKNDIMKLESVKKLQDCGGDKVDTAQLDKLKDNDKTLLTVWIADKKIVKLASSSTKQDADKSNLKGSLSAVIDYKKTEVAKPTGAKPLMTLVSEIQQSSGALASPSTVQPATRQ